MTDKQMERLQRWLPIIGTILAIGVAWGVMTAAVERKADLTDIQRIEHKVNALDTKIDALVRIACRADPKDSICPYK